MCPKGRVKEAIPRCLEYSATHGMPACHRVLVTVSMAVITHLDPTPYELYHLCSKRTKNWHLQCSGISRVWVQRTPMTSHLF